MHPIRTLIDGGNGTFLVRMAHGKGFAVIDAADAVAVGQYNWKRGHRSSPYAFTRLEDGRIVSLHRLLLASVPLIDHVNGDGLDCRRANMRPATAQQNAANRRRPLPSSGYWGVTFHRQTRRWQAHGAHRYIGLFDSVVDAAIAHDAAVLRAYGEFAVTNYPAFACGHSSEEGAHEGSRS